MAKSDKNAGQGVSTLEKPGNNQTEKINSTLVNQDHIRTIQAKRSYRSKLLISPRSGKPFFYFRYHGQELEGFLGRAYDCSFFNRGGSRIVDTIAGGVEEFFTGKYLSQLFEEHELEGKHIKITYIGDELTRYGHARKVYQVEKFATTDRHRKALQTERLTDNGS